MELERPLLDEVCEAPDEIPANQGLLCKTREEAGVTSLFSARAGMPTLKD